MIVINDNDAPIEAAKKIIYGTKPNNASDMVKALAKAITNDNAAGETIDMYSRDDIKEIRDYLNVWLDNNEDD